MTGNRGLLASAGGLFGTSVVTAASGAIFWVVAARAFDAAAVGVAGAALAASLLVARLGTVGLGTMLTGRLAVDRHRSWELTAGAMVTAGAFSGALGLVAIVLWGALGIGGGFLTALGGVLVVAGSVLTAAGFIVDGALVGLLMGGRQLARNVIASLGKLALLPVLVVFTVAGPTDTILLASVGGAAISMLVVLVAARPDRRRLRAIQPVARSWYGDALRHHVFNVVLMTPALLLPLIAPLALGAESSGYFFIAFTIAGLVWALPEAFALALYAQVSAEPERLAARLRYALVVTLAMGGAATVLMLVAARPLLSVFGPDYADAAESTLQVLTLGVFPIIVLSLYVPIVRQRGTFAAGTIVAASSVGVGAIGALIGASLAGATGFAAGWVLGTSVARLPIVVVIARVIRTSSGAAG